MRNIQWAIVALVLVAAPRAAAAAVDSTLTTVYLVRHAEKNTHAPGGDAGLTAKGILRAQDLVRALRDGGLDAIYATQFPRARLTAEPVARALGDSVHTYDANYPEALAQRIRAQHAGQRVLVVGHTDTIPQTYEALTGEKLEGPVDYDRLYVVLLLPGGGHRLLPLRYGAAP